MNLGLDEETSPPTPPVTKNLPLSSPLLGEKERGGEGRNLVRRTPIALSQGSEELAKITGVDVQTCSETLKQMFFWSSRIDKGLPFRLHQVYFSRG